MAEWDVLSEQPKDKPSADPWAPVSEKTAPGFASSGDKGIPDYSQAFKEDVGLGESILRGLAQGGERFAGFVNLVAGMPVARLIDTFTGNDKAQDTVGSWVTDNYTRAQQYADNPETQRQSLGAQVAQGVASTLPDLAATLATGGEYAGANTLVRPAINQSVGRAIAANLEQAAATGVRASAIPAAERAAELSKDVYQAGGTLPEALGAGATGGLATALTNALPASASGNVLVRAAQGAASNPVADLTQTTLENAAIPDRLGLDQQMSARDLLVSALVGAPLGAGLGERGLERINSPEAMRPLGESLTPEQAWAPISEVVAEPTQVKAAEAPVEVKSEARPPREEVTPAVQPEAAQAPKAEIPPVEATPTEAKPQEAVKPSTTPEAIPDEFIAKTKGGEWRLTDKEAAPGSDFSEFGQVREVVAYDGDTPIGSLLYANDGTPPTVNVEPEYQRKGVATAMLKLAKERGGVLGASDTGVSGKGRPTYRTDEGQAFRTGADESSVSLSPRLVEAPASPEVEAAPVKEPISAPVQETVQAPVMPREPSPEKVVEARPGAATSTKNAVTALERTREGRDPIIKEAARTNADTLATAVKTLNENPRRGEEIVSRLKNHGPSAISVDDEAALLVYKTNLRNERDDAAKVLGNPSASEEARDAAQRTWDRSEAQINEVDQATYASGREWGRLGQFRQRMLREDFTLEAMERRIRAVTGKPLTAEETGRVAELSKRINDLEDRLAKTGEQEEKQGSIQTYDELLKVMQREFRSAPKKRPTLAKLKDAADESRRILSEGIKSEKKPVRSDQAGSTALITELYHLTRIGAYHIANGAVKIADWTARMKSDLGDRFDQFRERLPEVFQASKTIAERPVSEGSSPAAVIEGIEGAPTGSDIRALAEAHIREGLRGEGPVISAVTESLKAKFGDKAPTEREVRRLFSNYGNATFPSKDAVKTELRQLRSLVQMQESIDRLSEGLPALKSGPQRDKATQAVREKRQQLNELLRRAASNAKTPEQLASYNDARVRNLKNQIEDLTKQIDTGERPEKKPPPQPSAEVVRLRRQRDELRRQLDQQGAGERKNESEKAAIRKKIEKIEEAISGKPKAIPEKQSRVDDLETSNLKAKLEDAKRQLAELTREPKYQEMRGKTFQRRIAELQQRMASGDFEKRVRTPRELNEANLKTQFELEKVKEEFERLRFEAELAKRTPVQKILGNTRDVVNLARAFMTSVDFSGLLRQGGFISYGHPLRAAKASVPALKAFASDKAEFAANKEIETRENYRLYKKFGLELTGIGAGPLSKVEEAYATRLLNRVPKLLGGGIVRGSGRSYAVLLNRLRADSFDAMIAALSRNGSKPTDEEGKAIANYINVATGRGKVGVSNNAGEVLNTVFFAPRLVASRFQLLAGQPLYGGTIRTRNMIAQEYARFLIGVSIAIALAAQLKDDDDDTPAITLDPRSANFGKVQFGKTFLDPLAGLAQVTTFLARTLTGENRNTKGELVPLRDQYRLTDYLPELGDGEVLKKVKYGGTTGFDVVANFIRSKLAPVPGAVVNTVQGTNMIGEPVSPGETAVSLVTPMSFGNIQEIMEEQGIPRGTAITMLGLLGMGVQYRKSKEERAAEQAKKEAEK